MTVLPRRSLLLVAAVFAWCGSGCITQRDDETVYLPIGDVRIEVDGDHSACWPDSICANATVVDRSGFDWRIAIDRIDGIEFVEGTGYLIDVRISGEPDSERTDLTNGRHAEIELLRVVEK